MALTRSVMSKDEEDAAHDTIEMEPPHSAPSEAPAGDAATTARAASTGVVHALWTQPTARERIAGSPLVPNGVQWADDGRVAVVSEASILISTFMSRELEMYIQHSPAVSKSFIFVPENTAHERIPLSIPVFSEPTDTHLPTNSMTYFLLNEKDRHQYNPKELSLSKSDGNAFVSATWGPRGSGPNSSCALLALTSSSRISLHFSSSFHLSWKEAAVFSENLFSFLESRHWVLRVGTGNKKATGAGSGETGGDTMNRSVDDTTSNGDAHVRSLVQDGVAPKSTKRATATKAKATAMAASKKRKRGQLASDASRADGSTVGVMSIDEYSRRCAMAGTLSVAWSPFVTNPEQHTTSLIAFSGRAMTTVWGYDYPSYEALTGAASTLADSTSPALSSLLSSTPFAWVDTEDHGWVTTSTWQEMHREIGVTHAHLRLALGTTSGNVLLANIPVMPRDVHVLAVPLERVVVAPHSQPVYCLRLGSRNMFGNSKRNDLIVASGSRISVWNIKKAKRAAPVTWKAHRGNVTGLNVDYFGEKIFSCGVDGRVCMWDKETGKELDLPGHVSADRGAIDNTSPSTEVFTTNRNGEAPNKGPMFGLAVSPNTTQIACLFVIPPAARPNRKSQADVSYSRVSSALEFLPSPYATSADAFVHAISQIIGKSRDMSTLTDVVWFCHEDNTASSSLQRTGDMTLPSLLRSLNGMAETPTSDGAGQPVYLRLCQELEQQYEVSTSAQSASTSENVPFFLQASYLIRSCITPASQHRKIRDRALHKIKRTLYVYWAERCLRGLLASHSQVKNFGDISKTERISALLMADFLSVQQPMSDASERLVTTVYNRLGSSDNVSRWSAYLQNRVDQQQSGAQTTVTDDEIKRDPSEENTSNPALSLTPPVPPPRQKCFICDEPVPFGELEQFCASGHTQDRCFLSFQVISSMDTWKCMGCGASACEIDFSDARSPYYLLENESTIATTTERTGAMQIVCRMCGNYCSFLKY